MTSHDDLPVCPRARSPRLARLLLLSACTVGLGGLALPGAVPARPAPTTASAVNSGFSIDQATVTLPALTRVAAQKASRTRELQVRPRRTARRQSHQVEVRWGRPSGTGVISPFGMRWGRMHKGIDFGAPYGAPISAIGSGVVIGAGYLSEESGYGLITLIRHPDGMVSAYAHQSRTFVQAGDHVQVGQLIGLVGSTGASTGPHLHFEIRTSTHGGQINPVPWLRQHGVSV
ncbi:MAG: secreted peptidase [Frankiales bacterium]|nr:secreted peptidase [Frankiales bacterium]